MDSAKYTRVRNVAPYVDVAFDRFLTRLALGAKQQNRIAFLDEREEADLNGKAQMIATAVKRLEEAMMTTGFPTPPDFRQAVTEFAISLCADEIG